MKNLKKNVLVVALSLMLALGGIVLVNPAMAAEQNAKPAVEQSTTQNVKHDAVKSEKHHKKHHNKKHHAKANATQKAE